MNWLKKGPELKLPKLRKPKLGAGGGKGPSIKPPAFLADLYYDLRDRRLLLPLTLVIVAIAAVPLLLGDSEQVELPPPVAVSGGGEAAGSASASLAVVEAKPGLRDYRKRLDGRTATNPFKQRYTSVPDNAKVESTSVDSTTGGGESGEATLEVVEGDTGVTPPSSGEGGSTRFYELVIDVQIQRSETTPDGGEKRGELEVRKNVPVLTQLPGKQTPVVTTMGANFKKERLFFLVSHQVESISGEYACVTRGEICELLEVRLGNLLEFVFEPSGARYSLKVTKADLVPLREGRGTRSSRTDVTRSFPGLSLEAGSGSVSEIAQTKPNPR
jgi:hypothetical protein